MRIRLESIVCSGCGGLPCKSVGNCAFSGAEMRGKEAEGGICLLRSLKTQIGTKHTKNTLNPVVAHLAGCVSKNKKAQNTQIPASHFVYFVYSCVTDTQPESRAVTDFLPLFVCFVCFREIKKGHKAPVGVVTVKQAGSSCASSSLFLPLRSRGLLASR